MDQRPAFSVARAAGALDIFGGDVYGVANFKGGLTGNLTGNVTGNVSGTASNVTGTVAVANGGTGKTNGKDAANYFMNALDTGSSTPADADYYISQYVNGGTTTTTYHRRPMTALWAYIKGKIDAAGTYTNTDTKNTAGSTDTSSKIFLIGATSQAANPQTYSHDTAYVGTNGHLYSASKEVLVGGSNAASAVTITPSTTDVYSMTSAGSVTAGTATTPAAINTSKFSGGSFTRGSFSGGSLTFAINGSDSNQLDITFTPATHGNDTFTAASLQSGFYTAGTKGTPTAVTLPGRSSVIKAWTGYSAATAAAQTFTGAKS